MTLLTLNQTNVFNSPEAHQELVDETYEKIYSSFYQEPRLEESNDLTKEDERHSYLASQPSWGIFSGESAPHQEPWYSGPPSHAHYTNVRLNPDDIDEFGESLIGRIIGAEGRHLQFITETSGIHYIWWNKDWNKDWRDQDPLCPYIGVFEMWGPHTNLTTAVEMLNDHIDFVIRSFEESDEDELDMSDPDSIS